MKKINLFALSLLTLSSAAALASCGGQKGPKQKEDVYFRTQAMMIEDTNGKGLKLKKTEYTPEECATMTVDNKENLKYEAQDVVITVEPKPGFTFREYNPKTWAPISGPVHPYVGLGGPHALYNYQLQENVAWTFADKSELNETTGLYKEKYVITVKAEFFKKNIVIDYGNVTGLNNYVYVYGSGRYNEIFSDDASTLTGNFGYGAGIYENKPEYSDYTVAGKGAIVTYGIKDQYVGTYNFRGWSDKPVTPQPANADKTKYEYDHFKIKAYEKKGDTTPKEILSVYDTSIEESKQPFKVEITGEHEQYITFFIDWTLLANPSDYSIRFGDIQVELSNPSIEVGGEVGFDDAYRDLGAKQYRCDFFQYANEDTPLPFTKNGEVKTYDGDGQYTFKRATHKAQFEENEAIYYSMIFELPYEHKDYFSVEIGAEVKRIDVDLVNGAPSGYTDYHVIEDVPVETGETELPYWTSEDGKWFLVQLNPQNRTCDNALPAKFQKHQNLYYLYTTDLHSVSKEVIIKVCKNQAPEFVNFALNPSSQDYGSIVTDKIQCVNERTVDIDFNPTNPYANYTVALATDVEGHTNCFEATYIPASTGYATIRIRNAGESEERFAKDETFTITLNPAATCVVAMGQTSVLGEFVILDESYQIVETVETGVYQPVIPEDTYELHSYFRLRDEYYTQFLNDEYINCVVYYNNQTFDATISIENMPENVIDIGFSTIATGEPISKNGGLIEIKLGYIHANINYNFEGPEIPSAREMNLGIFVGNGDGLQIMFKYYGDPMLAKWIRASKNQDTSKDLGTFLPDIEVVLGEYFEEEGYTLIYLNLFLNRSVTNVVRNGVFIDIDLYMEQQPEPVL